MPNRFTSERVASLLAAVHELRDELLERERANAETLSRIPDARVASARNLLHYLALRGRDLRLLQLELSRLGLSSLGRAEAHVLATVDAVLATLHRIAGTEFERGTTGVPPVDHDAGDHLLERHAEELLGPAPAHRGTRIMVTLPSEAADVPQLVEDLIEAGMDVARINSAHDDAEVWRAMAAHVRDAAARQGREVRILVDLGGPKLRTGTLAGEGPDRIVLEVGDTVLLTMDDAPGRAEVRASDGTVHEPARISCTIGRALRGARPGESVWFDDGKIGGVVEEVADDHLRVRIERAKPGGAKLRAGKGVNFPDTRLDVAHLTDDDRRALDTAVEIADLVGMSFVERPADVEELHAELDRRDASHIGVVLKIETRRAFESLPELLLAGLQSPPLGVMVARGDLAVEVGFARLAEVQEEILWLCEAAHVPVIWATQVLETLAKKGIPSRAEVSDAALGVRAECVMLNKGPHVTRAVSFLADVLGRMRAHQHKKQATLRRLGLATPAHGGAR